MQLQHVRVLEAHHKLHDVQQLADTHFTKATLGHAGNSTLLFGLIWAIEAVSRVLRTKQHSMRHTSCCRTAAIHNTTPTHLVLLYTAVD